MDWLRQELLVFFVLPLVGIIFGFLWLIWAIRGKRDVKLTVHGFGLAVTLASEADDTSTPPTPEEAP